MGRFPADTTSWRWLCRNIPAYYLADTGRNLFYNKDKSVACPVIFGDGEGTS